MLKKVILFTLLSYGISAYASEAQSFKQEPNLLAKSHWETGVRLFYMQTNSAFHRYDLNNKKHVIDKYSTPPANLGFELSASYYPTNENDMTLIFSRLVYNKSSDNHILDFKSYKLNLELGQKFNFSASTHGRLFAGLQSLYHLSSDEWTRQDLTNHNYNNFRGFGPRVGSDMSTDLPKGFQAFAEGAMSLLVGESKGYIAQTDSYDKSVLKQTQLVPGIDAKLGLSYQDHLKHGFLTVAVGWMVNHYFDLITMPGSGGKGTSLTENGPFINFRWRSDD